MTGLRFDAVTTEKQTEFCKVSTHTDIRSTIFNCMKVGGLGGDMKHLVANAHNPMKILSMIDSLIQNHIRIDPLSEITKDLKFARQNIEMVMRG